MPRETFPSQIETIFEVMQRIDFSGMLGRNLSRMPVILYFLGVILSVLIGVIFIFFKVRAKC